jgi:hypothetical protein
MSHEIDGKEDMEEVWDVSSECVTHGENCEGTEVETIHRVVEQSETGEAAEWRPVSLKMKFNVKCSVSQEERSIFCEVIVSVTLTKKVYMYVSYSKQCPI